jgi:hypothetical protein
MVVPVFFFETGMSTVPVLKPRDLSLSARDGFFSDAIISSNDYNQCKIDVLVL